MNRRTGKVWVKRFVCAHDCGLVVNPEALRRTLEGGMLYALSRALREEVQFDTEKVTSVDWVTHPTLRHTDTPAAIDIVMVNGDPNPNRPDLPHYGPLERNGLQDDACGVGTRFTTRPAFGSDGPVQRRACARGAQVSGGVVEGG